MKTLLLSSSSSMTSRVFGIHLGFRHHSHRRILDGANTVGAHHLVVLVLDDVAMPDELAGVLKWARTRVTWPG